MKSFIDVGRRAAAASLAVSDNRSPRDRCARRLRARSAPRVEACGAHCGCSSREFRSVCKSSARYYKAARRIWPFKTAESPWRGYKIAEYTCCGMYSPFGTDLCTDKLSWEQRFYRHRLQTCQRRRFTLPTTSLELGESSPLVVISHLVNLERVWRRRSLERIRVV